MHQARFVKLFLSIFAVFGFPDDHFPGGNRGGYTRVHVRSYGTLFRLVIILYIVSIFPFTDQPWLA